MESINSFYDEKVERIVRSKLDKFTYGSEVEIGGLLPTENVEMISDKKWDDRQSKEKKIKGLFKKGIVKNTD